MIALHYVYGGALLVAACFAMWGLARVAWGPEDCHPRR